MGLAEGDLPSSSSSPSPPSSPSLSILSSSSSPSVPSLPHPSSPSSPSSLPLPSSSSSSSLPPHPSSSSSSLPPPPSSSASLVLLFRIPFRRLCLWALVPPVCAILGVFLLAYFLHRDELFNYQWTCGIARLPSVSRVLNLPAERVLWDFAVALHFPLRPLVSLHYFFRWPSADFKPSSASASPSASPLSSASPSASVSDSASSSSASVLRPLLLLSSIGDHLCLVGLSFVAEREHAQLHVCLFSAFLFLSFFHFTLQSMLLRPPRLARRLRTGSLALLCLLVPFVIASFTIHQLFCTDYSYELFVLGEYLTIAAIFTFNGAVLLDNHPNCGYAIFLIRPKKSKNTLKNDGNH